ncbi:MAG: START domain-containing protein [Leptospira sp.]|nr:START domain-containing protein [Leptospira sp.]
MKAKYSLLLLFLCIIIGTTPAYSQSWKSAKNKNGIQVFTRSVEGSSLKEFMGKATVNASTEKIVALIKNTASYTSWLHDCKEAKMLDEKNRLEWYIYLRNGAPWPVSDRDVVVQAKMTEAKDGKIVISMKNSPTPNVPNKSGVVRIPSLKGYWKITPMEDGKSEVIYQAHTDPGGNIPEVAANIVVVDIPYNSLFNMKKKLE